MAALKKRDLSAEISRYAKPDVKIVQQDESLEYIYHLLLQRGLGLVAVVDQGDLVGVVDQAGMQNFLRLQAR